MNMLSTIVPKSDQINADDLIGKTMTITVNEVTFSGGAEQPVSMFFEGSDKAFRPCKSMCRVLVAAWGPDAKQYVGRSMTLYRDAEVKFGGMAVGGIRISHMTHLDGPLSMALTATKGSRKMFKVAPLVAPRADVGPNIVAARAAIDAARSLDDLRDVRTRFGDAPWWGDVVRELNARRKEFEPPATEGPDDTQRGEAHHDAAGDEIDPQRAKAHDIAEAAGKVGNWPDLNSLRADNKAHVAVMDEATSQIVVDAYAAAEDRVRGL